jgi:hypothetical protein
MIPFSLVLLLIISFASCGKSSSLEVIPEPVVDQISVSSPEICLDSYVWIISANPCLSLKGEKDNTRLNSRIRLIYEVDRFDVEFPVGLSLKLDNTYYNLIRVGTEYGSSLQLVSELPEGLVPTILGAKEISISYTNRKDTFNTKLSSSQAEKFKEYLKNIREALDKEPKLQIKK